MTPSSPIQQQEWTFRQIVWATLVFTFVTASFWVVYRFSSVVFMLFIAIIIGTVLRPAVAWLNGRGIQRVAGAVLVYLLIFGLIAGFLLLLFPLIAEQGDRIGASVPGYYQTFRNWIAEHPNPLLSELRQFLPASLSFFRLARQAEEDMLHSAGQAFGYLKTAVRGLFTATAVALLSFYWTLYGPRAIQSLLLLLPAAARENLRTLIAAMETRVSFYVVGQGVLCLIVGVLALIAYALIGLPNALVLALFAGVFEAVPMVGPLLGAIPAAAVALSVSPAKLLWVVVATAAIQQVENTLLVPRIMRQAVGVNPFVSLLSIFAFGSLFGIPGALMAIPLAAVAQLLLDRFIFSPEAIDLDVSDGRDYASRIRYEAQELVQDIRKHVRLNNDEPSLVIRETDLVMDEIEAIAADLDSLLAEASAQQTAASVGSKTS
ncbi:MAG: AI-2E family transporter [Chloroflexota bacterium]